jgi:hypothetical protein
MFLMIEFRHTFKYVLEKPEQLITFRRFWLTTPNFYQSMLYDGQIISAKTGQNERFFQ